MLCFFLSTGNYTYRYPASYPPVISVSAMKRGLQHAKFSTYNDQVELTGPGKVRYSYILLQYYKHELYIFLSYCHY